MRKPIEKRLSIDLPDLKRRGFFGQKSSGSIHWGMGDQLIASVAVAIRFDAMHPHLGGTLTLTYMHSEQALKQVIPMQYIASNLKRGGIWYLICPTTGRRCRTLYYGQNGFVSRHAEGTLRYRSQLISRNERTRTSGLRQLAKLKRRLASMEWFTKTNSKHSYRGKPTRPMARHTKLHSSSDGDSSPS